MLDAKGLYRLEMRLSQYVASRSFSKPQLTSEEHDILKLSPKFESDIAKRMAAPETPRKQP
jgi:hypothetical protein